MAHVQILDIGAVHESIAVLTVEHAAAGGHGGQNTLHIGAHGVVIAKPYAPDHLHIGVGVTDGGHLLIGDTAAVHVHIGKSGHIAHGLIYGSAAVLNRDVAEIYLGVVNVNLLAVKLKAVAELGIGQKLLNKADILPAELRTLSSQSYTLNLRQVGQNFRCGADIAAALAGEVQLLGGVIKHSAVGHGDGVFYLYLRIALSPIVDFLHALTAGKVGRFEQGQAGQKLGLTGLKLDVKLGGGLNIKLTGGKFHGLGAGDSLGGFLYLAAAAQKKAGTEQTYY